jgi:hypothetical protein
MPINFLESKYQNTTNKKRFGLCDDVPPPHKPAYLDEKNGKKWIAVVNNEYRFLLLFVALDNSIDLKKDNGKKDKCCDALLSYNSTMIFVELKQRTDSEWIKDGEKQLRQTIKHFELSEDAQRYPNKKAYIANSKCPKFRTTQKMRMDKFYGETGYVLRIENRINIE